MASRSLGALTLQLIIGLGGFKGPLTQAERELEKRTKAMSKRASELGRSIGKALGIGILSFTASVGAAITAIKSSINAMDDMSKAAQRANLPTESFSRLAYAASLADVSVEDLQGSLGKLAKAQGEALKATSQQARVFDALGISAKNADGSLRSTDQVFADFADSFQKFRGSPEVIAAGMHIFGRSFQNLIPLLKDGSEGLKRAGVEADALGITLSTKAGREAEEFNDNLTRLTTAVQGVVQSVAIELLPQLVSMTDKFVEIATDGTTAKEAVANFKVALDGVISITGSFVSAAESIRSALGGIKSDSDDSAESLRQLVQSARGLAAIPASMAAYFDAVVTGSDEAKKRFREANEEIRAGFSGKPIGSNRINLPDAPWLDIPALNGRQPFSAVPTPFVGLPPDTSKLTEALGDRPKTTKAKSGKSEAEKEAEKVARAIEQMTKAQQDWQNELNQTGNPIADEYASRLREITEQAKGFAEEGVPAEKVKAFTDEMQKLATSLRDSDIAEFQKEFNEASDQMAASMQGPMKQALLDYQIEVAKIDKLLKLGIITIEDYNERLGLLTKQRDEPVTGMLDAIREEIMLLGMTNEEQEIYNNLKRAGALEAGTARDAIIAETKALQAFREEAAFLDDLKLGLSDMFVDFVSGAKTAKEAFGDFADAIYARALQFVADKAIQALFDAFSGKGSSSSSSGSSTGGGLTGLFTSILSAFGGGKAGGGSVGPFSLNPVNERGPELLSVNGNDYLMMGANAGRITPNHQLSGAGAPFNQINNFNLPRRMDNRSEMQIRQAAGEGARDAIRRNGR